MRVIAALLCMMHVIFLNRGQVGLEVESWISNLESGLAPWFYWIIITSNIRWAIIYPSITMQWCATEFSLFIFFSLQAERWPSHIRRPEMLIVMYSILALISTCHGDCHLWQFYLVFHLAVSFSFSYGSLILFLLW